MKKLLLPLLLFIGFTASAQLPGATKINSRYEWLAGKFLQLKLPIYADTSQYPLWIPRLAGDVMLDTAGTDAGTVYVRYGQPPYWQAIKGDTSGSGGGGSDTASTWIAQGLGVLLYEQGDTLTITAPSGTFSLRDAGITTEAKYDSLVSATGSRNATWMLDTIIPVTVSKTWPANIQLFIENGGGFNVSATRTLTIAAPTTIGRYAVFFGAGNVSLGVKSVSTVFPEWWGASAHISGDATDDQAAHAKAFIGGTNIKHMTLGAGIYEFAGKLTVPQGWRIVGANWQASTWKAMDVMDAVASITSRVFIEKMRINGSFLAARGLDVLAGNRCQVENIEFLNFTDYGMEVGVMNNSTFSNNTFQYAGKAQLYLNGALNCTFIGNNGNSDEFLIGDSTTRGVLVKDSRNCRFIGGIWERSNNKYQWQVDFSEDLHLQDMEINNGEVGLYVAGGTVTADHVEFTNPKYRAMYAAGGGTINVINNGTAMTGGSNTRPMSFLNAGNIKYNGSSAYPLWSYSLRGGSAGSAYGASSIAYDSLKQNFTVTTTASMASGWSVGFGTSSYNTPVGTGLNFRTHIKNISTGQPLIAYIELAAGGRRFMGYLTPGMNSVHYTARGDERYRVDIGAGTAAITSFNPSLAELWITAGDSTTNSDTATKYDVLEIAANTSDNSKLRVFSTEQVQSLIAGGGGGYSGGNIAAADFSTIDDGDYYQGFPFATTIKDTIYTTFKRGFEHVAQGWIPLYRSVDGGMSWDSINTVVPKGQGSTCLITAINDTLFVSYDKAAESAKWFFGYSADFGKTFVTTDSLEISGWGMTGYGKYIKMPSGRFFLAAYLFRSGEYSLRLLTSANGRTGWSSYATIKEDVNTTMNLNEIWIEKIQDGATTDATTKLIAVVRDELLGGPVQFTSSNGGATWTERGRVNALKSPDDIYGAPTEVVQYGGNIYLISARRTNLPGLSTAYDMYLGYSRGVIDSIFTTPAKWGPVRRIYNSEVNRTGGIMIDFGYFVSYNLNGNLRVIGYDVSPKNIYLDDTTRTQIITMPIFDLGMTEIYGTTNQAITANTETLVQMPYKAYDTELSFDTLTGLINVVKPGIYSLKAVANFGPESSGTYRKAYLKVIKEAAPTANRVVAEKIIQPTSDFNFKHIDLEATQYLHAGEKIGFYVIGDGIDELRNSSEIQNRATLTVKMIRK